MPRDLWICRECSFGNVEVVIHWLLSCSAWEASRFPLMLKMREYYIDVPALNEGEVQMILTAACQIPSNMKIHTVV